MPSNLVENGYLLSWFQNSVISDNSYDCEKTCNESDLYMFGLDDFYHFSQQLAQRNFSIHENVTKTNEFVNLCTTVEFDFATRTWIGWIPEIAQFKNLKWIRLNQIDFFKFKKGSRIHPRHGLIEQHLSTINSLRNGIPRLVLCGITTVAYHRYNHFNRSLLSSSFESMSMGLF